MEPKACEVQNLVSKLLKKLGTFNKHDLVENNVRKLMLVINVSRKCNQSISKTWQ